MKFSGNQKLQAGLVNFTVSDNIRPTG